MTVTPPSRPAQPMRGRRAIAPPPRASRAVSELVSGFSAKFGAGMGDIAARWSDIVGEKTARMCTPVKLTGRGRKGTLHLAAPGPAAVMVEAQAAHILEQLNTFCGRDMAGRVAITRASARTATATARSTPGSPSPSAPRPARVKTPPQLAPAAALQLEDDLATVENTRLRSALLKLGRAALAEAAEERRERDGARR